MPERLAAINARLDATKIGGRKKRVLHLAQADEGTGST
jgi:hypothetical protein